MARVGEPVVIPVGAGSDRDSRWRPSYRRRANPELHGRPCPPGVALNVPEVRNRYCAVAVDVDGEARATGAVDPGAPRMRVPSQGPLPPSCSERLRLPITVNVYFVAASFMTLKSITASATVIVTGIEAPPRLQYQAST